MHHKKAEVAVTEYRRQNTELRISALCGIFFAASTPRESNACLVCKSFYGIFPVRHHNLVPLIPLPQTKKHSLMKLSSFIINLLVIAFFALISYGLTGSIAVRSTMGIILALISLGATIMFLYLLPKLKQQPGEEERTDG